MKKLMLSITILLGCLSSASAEPYWLQKPVQCAKPQEVVTQQARVHLEVPFLIMYGTTIDTRGIMHDTSYILSVNMETKTWTMIEFASKEERACVIATGTGLKLAPQEKEININFKPLTLY